MDESIQQLNDLELAVLASLVAEEHCIFSTDTKSTAELRDELHAICVHTFGLQSTSVTCSAETSVDDLNEALLVENLDEPDEVLDRHEEPSSAALNVGFSRVGRSPSPTKSNIDSERRRIADVIIVANLDTADTSVQIQVLELLRTKRVFTRTSMHTAPKDFLFIGIMSRPDSKLTHHLNDIFCMSHFHPSEDGLPYADGLLEKDSPSLPKADVKLLREQAQAVRMTGEVAAYLHNVVLFMRTSRYVAGGVTATATKQLRTLSHALASLHGLDYVPPSLVVLATHKIYPHRLVLANADTEKSLLWGSDPRAIQRMLEGITVESVIEDVLASFESPL